ncbi:E3 ubiquitin-protein ligase DZIP3-like [Stegostoma tigrinum]|uniref:E3 ubiquitin-protein ligase DZIP3-like n=1 Tax=Stegostoma tigrinum TaxID=3053191 RepID=UPI00202B6C34|nr:E3 ubiquitin-protein ligase DZIP3-like [Stegostoma tigrinum]
MGPEAEEQVTCLEMKSDYVQEPSRNDSLDIIKKLGIVQSMNTDEKIKQFQIFLSTALINDLVRQLSEVQYLFLLHYFVMALCSRGQAQDLSEAEKQIMAIKKMTKETPECQSFVYVVYHTLGCLYFKQNRFEDAMKWFQNSKQEFQDNPPTIEWTDVVLKAEEIEPKHFVIKINEYIEICKHAPNPVAICQDANCHGYYKRQIYPSDPDYKGYIEFCCDSYCLISYHLTCWKRLKETRYHGKSNQHFCSMKCMSSDCEGLIIKCVIHQASGSIQTEFEIKISDQSSQISTVKHEEKAVDTPEGSNQCNEQNEYEKGRKEKETDIPLSTDKCRLFHEIAMKRKLIESAIVETGKIPKLIISCNLEEAFVEKNSEITAEMIVNHVLEWNCNYKIRQFLMMFKYENLSNHPELKEWITYILELGDQCSLCFLYSYKNVIIQILHDMENLLNFAQKLLSRKALSKEEIKVLAVTPSEQRPNMLMEQMTSHKDVWKMGELVFALGEEQDQLPKLKPLFDEFNREFEKFNKGHVPSFGTILPADPLSQNMDYTLFYRLLHLLIIKGTEVLLQIFDRAVPPQILKRELLKNKRILEPYHKGSSRSVLNSGEWTLLFPPDNEQPDSKRFDITLLASLIRHLKILPAPRGGWDAEPLANDQSKSAAVLHLWNFRNKLLFETLNTGIEEPEFAIEWDRITEVLVSLGADRKSLKELKNCPVEKLWEDHHQLAGYLGKPVADVMQLLLSFFQQGTPIQTKGEMSTNSTGLPALTATQETKEQTMEPADLKNDDDSMVSKAKTKSKKKKKKSKGKKAQTNEDNQNITQDITPHQCETLSIPVQENQVDGSRSKKQVANSSCDVSTFSASVAASSQLAFGTMPNNSNAGPFLTSHDVNKLDDFPDQTYQSDGELDDIENTLIDEESTGSSVCTPSDLYSSSSVGDGAINVQQNLWQNVKEKSEMRQKLLALQNENQTLVRNLDQLITKLKEEQQQRIRAENQYSRLQERYQLEISRVNQQLQSKDEEIKKITTQFANERTLWNKDKAKLEDISAKNITKLVEATKRAVAAEILFLECRRDNGLFQLQQAEQDSSVRLRTAEENLTGNPESAHLHATVDGWQAIVADIRNKIDFTKNQFDEQINLVKSGTKLSMLPKIKIPPPPPHPDAVMKHFLEQHLQAKASDVLTGFGPSKSSSGTLTNVTGQAEASAAAYEQVRGTIPISEQTASQQFLPATKGSTGLTATLGGTRGKNSFERIMERLSTSYPHFTRGSLTDFLKEVRLSNGGSLSGLSYDEIVNKVAQLVESKLSESSNSGQNQPPNQFAWSSSRQQEFNSWEGARAMTEEQDPCVICHEELTVESMLVLPCAHKFHSQCIESWLNEQRTCPTCRLHVVLPQEFPGLPSRKVPHYAQFRNRNK